MNYDSAAWGALAFSLATLLGVVTFFRWRRHGLTALLRGAAWTILPVAAWLTGVLELAFDIVDSVGTWAVHLVFSPVVWLGIVLAGVSALLFGTAAVVGGRRGERHSRRPGERPGQRRRQRRRDEPAEVARAERPRAVGKAAIGDDDLDDIEAILRRHGIS